MKTQKQKIQRYKKELESVLQNAVTGRKIPQKFRWMFVRDIADYLEICRFAIKGKLKKAISLYEDLDTNARDEFPYEILEANENI